MNIALFHNDLPNPDEKPGGVSVAVHRLANALTNHPRDSVTVFSLSDEPETSLYNHVRLFPKASWLRSKIAARFILPLALNRVDFSDFDVLHLHGDDWFFFRRSVPTIRTFHGSALGEARSSSSLKRRLNQYLIYTLEQLSARIATKSVAVGPGAASIYQASEVVGNGIELGLFQEGPKTDYPSILFVGTWCGRKRGRQMFKMFTEQVSSYVPDARLFMVSEKCASHDKVVHFPRPNKEKLATLYRRSWVLAHPSIYEGFGIPYVEAMASGTTVISSPNEGADYVLSNGEYGVIAEDDDFADELVDLLENPDRRQHYEKKSKKRSEDFSWGKIAERHRRVYQDSIKLFDKHG